MLSRSSSPTMELAAAFGIIIGASYIIKRLSSEKKLPLPPGPTRLPLLGNLFTMPQSMVHVAYSEISKELNSDIIAFDTLGLTIIVLNSSKVASELLDKRSAIYSGRPRIPIICDVDFLDWGKSVTFSNYGDRWRCDRRMLHESLHKGVVHQYFPVQEKYIHMLAKRLISSPSTFECFVNEVGFALGSGIVEATYGYTPQSSDDRWLKDIREATEHVSRAALPTAFMANFIPELKYMPDWFPGTGWKKVISDWRKHKDYIISAPYAWCKEQIRGGTAMPCIIQKILSTFPSYRPGVEDDRQIELLGAIIFGAAGHTTGGFTEFFLLAMVMHPEVALKIQAELDSVLGYAERLPTMEDSDHLPYVRNTLQELLRWQQVLPLSIPHTVIEDDEYQGYFIPKGSMVIPNAWAMTRDESVYTEPERFNPDRFLDPSVPPAPSFGFGRRACPGSHFAEANLFLMIATLMYIFNIRRAVDENGEEISVEVRIKDNADFTCKPEPFQFDMTPRSEAHKRLVVGIEG